MSAASEILAELRARGVNARRLAVDSRRVAPDDVFLAMPGAHADGRAFIADAIARGAAAVLAEAGKVGAGETVLPPVGAGLPATSMPEPAQIAGEPAPTRLRSAVQAVSPPGRPEAKRHAPEAQPAPYPESTLPVTDERSEHKVSPPAREGLGEGGPTEGGPTEGGPTEEGPTEEGPKLGAGGTVPVLAVADLAAHAGELAHLVYGKPSERLWLCGVTGTNGKTSVSQWIAQALNALGCKCGVIGTLGNGFPPQLDASPNTTPDAVSLHAALARFVDAGAVACAMEVSSIGLDQGRANGVHFDVAVFTNLTRDHLEYHGTMEAYGAAKAKLFDAPGLNAAVLNLDDPCGAELAARLRGRVRTIGYTLADAGGADLVLRAANLAQTGAGIAFEVAGVRYAAPLVGRFNAANLLAVIGALLAGDETPDDIAAVLPRLAPPPGRMQTLGGADAPLVVVDYAHSPDALEHVLATLRETAAARGGRLVCVFGCGGERDAGKRPLMGAIAERLADRVVVTSDNPRGEAPMDIIAAILAGMEGRPEVEAARASAVAAAIADADARDVVLLAGKGHEPYQEIAGERLPYSDIETAQRALAARGARSVRETEPC